jgi:hypothetical protein
MEGEKVEEKIEVNQEVIVLDPTEVPTEGTKLSKN